jgi:hypothetical protein
LVVAAVTVNVNATGNPALGGGVAATAITSVGDPAIPTVTVPDAWPEADGVVGAAGVVPPVAGGVVGVVAVAPTLAVTVA